MDAHNLTKAIANSREVYRQALEGCEENIKKWSEHQKEYTVLKERLEEFPKKISHDVMVPLGKVALMPGQLIHTNEVLVLLGDNWFVMRSAHQAKEIVDRRLKYVAETLSKYEAERKLFIDRLEATKDLFSEADDGDVFEIREPVPSTIEKQKKIRIAHEPGSMKKTTGGPSEPSNAESSKKVSDQDFSDLMNRLDELHYEERFDERREDGLPSSSKGNGSSADAAGSSRKVAWKDHLDSSISSDPADSPSTALSASISTDDARPSKSILKNRDEQTPVGDLPPSPYEPRQKVISSVTEEAFSGMVLERTPEPSAALPPAAEPQRRVSRFAQERAGLKKQ